MIQSTDSNIESDLNRLLSEKKIVVAMVGSPTCKACKTTKSNIEKFYTDTPNHRLAIIYMDRTYNDKLESQYYQMNEMNEYPKTVVYYTDMEDKSFNEGVITVEQLIKYNESDRC